MVSDLFGAFCGRKSSCGHFAGTEEMDRKAVFAHMAICALGRCPVSDGGACFRESACPCAAPTGKTSGADSTPSSGTDYDRTAGPCGYR